MKIAYFSDLHIDSYTSHLNEVAHAIYDYLKIENPDALILAGDIANTQQSISLFLHSLQDLPFQKIFVPGNHDLWIESGRQLRKGFDSGYKLITQFISVQS